MALQRSTFAGPVSPGRACPGGYEPPGQAYLTGGDHIGMSRATSTKVKWTTQ